MASPTQLQRDAEPPVDLAAVRALLDDMGWSDTCPCSRCTLYRSLRPLCDEVEALRAEVARLRAAGAGQP